MKSKHFNSTNMFDGPLQWYFIQYGDYSDERYSCRFSL